MGIEIGGNNLNVGLAWLREMHEQESHDLAVQAANRSYQLELSRMAQSRQDAHSHDLATASANKQAIDSRNIEMRAAAQHAAQTMAQQQQFHGDEVSHQNAVLQQQAQLRADSLAAQQQANQDRIQGRAQDIVQRDKDHAQRLADALAQHDEWKKDQAAAAEQTRSVARAQSVAAIATKAYETARLQGAPPEDAQKYADEAAKAHAHAFDLANGTPSADAPKATTPPTSDAKASDAKSSDSDSPPTPKGNALPTPDAESEDPTTPRDDMPPAPSDALPDVSAPAAQPPAAGSPTDSFNLPSMPDDAEVHSAVAVPPSWMEDEGPPGDGTMPGKPTDDETPPMPPVVTTAVPSTPPNANDMADAAIGAAMDDTPVQPVPSTTPGGTPDMNDSGPPGAVGPASTPPSTDFFVNKANQKKTDYQAQQTRLQTDSATRQTAAQEKSERDAATLKDKQDAIANKQNALKYAVNNAKKEADDAAFGKIPGIGPHDVLDAHQARAYDELPPNPYANPSLAAELKRINDDEIKRASDARAAGILNATPRNPEGVWQSKYSKTSAAHRGETAGKIGDLHQNYPEQPAAPAPAPQAPATPPPTTTQPASGAAPVETHPPLTKYGKTYVWDGHRYAQKE